jgi:CBS domain containing-hemolysin-like protein
MPPWWNLALVPLLIALNAFFVAGEYAVVATRRPQLEALRRRGRVRTARAMGRLKDDPASAIGAIQVCITMTNLLLGWIGEPAMTAVLSTVFAPLADLVPPAAFRAASFGLSFVIVTLLTVVFSELLPKALTLRYVMPVATLTAVPVNVVLRATRPLVWLMNTMADMVSRPLGLGSVTDMEREWHTAEEIRQITAEAAAQGALTPRERSLVLNSLALGKRRARQIMVPRMRVAYLDLRRSMDDNRRVMNEYLHTRLPLVDGGLDKVVGWVPVKEFLSAYNAAGDSSVLQLLARPPVFQPENVSLDKLLAVFHNNQTEMVFVVDEFGGVEGIVTLQDVIDELLAEVVPEARQPPSGDGARPGVRETQLTVPGDLALHELAARIGRNEWGAGGSAATVGGLIVSRLGRFPAVGEELTVDGVRLRVDQVDGPTVKRVRVDANPAPGPDAAPAGPSVPPQ